MNDAPFTEQQLVETLSKTGGNVSEAARLLNCHRETVRKYRDEVLKVTRYVVTNAVNNTPVYRPFWDSLQNYCRENDAQLLVIPSLYKNPTAMKVNDPVWYPLEIISHICQTQRDLNDRVMVMGDVPIQPTAADPLSGMEPHAQGRWAFFGHPQVAMRVIPSAMDKTPPVIHTTGSVSEKQYSQSKTGKKAELHHTYAAVVIECVGTYRAHYRQLIADDAGVFYDIAGKRVRKYTPKSIEDCDSVAALVTGDEHIIVASDRVMDATFYRPDSIVGVTRPTAIYRHDVLDFFSRNHHHTDPIQNFVKHLKGSDDVRAEINQAINFLEQTTPDGSTSYVVASNHNEALDRWIREADPKRDPRNARVLHEIASLVYRIAEETGTHKINTFEVYAREAGLSEKVQFLERNKSHEVQGIDVSQHFDKGSNGGRGSLATFARVATRTVGGHSHTPGINKGAVQVGYCGDGLDYQSGLSSWMNTHCLIYQNGKRQLINILSDGSFVA